MVKPTIDGDAIMKSNMTGRKDLGVMRVPAQAIPKQSKTMTKTSNGNSNDKTGVTKDIAAKMKKVMSAKGMLDKC